jgi:hypothetical protein
MFQFFPRVLRLQLFLSLLCPSPSGHFLSFKNIFRTPWGLFLSANNVFRRSRGSQFSPNFFPNPTSLVSYDYKSFSSFSEPQNFSKPQKRRFQFSPEIPRPRLISSFLTSNHSGHIYNFKIFISPTERAKHPEALYVCSLQTNPLGKFSK